MKKNYADPQLIIVSIVIVVFLGIITALEPTWWPYTLAVLGGYGILFYLMRNNP